MAVDHGKRLDELINRVQPRFRRRFLDVVRQIRDRHTTRELTRLLEQNRISAALELVERAALAMSSTWGDVYIMSGQEAANVVGRSLRTSVVFDRTNDRAVAAVRRNQLRMIREFSDEQRRAVSLALQHATERGLNPRQAALMFRDSIGLTSRQVAAVNRYRQLLETGSLEALQRGLRDRRFDSSVRSAASSGQALSREHIDRMVSRYRDRYVTYRAETIARTEALRSVHEGSDELYRQAIENGTLAADELTQTWITSRDERVRNSHAAMHGQQQPMGQPFTSGNGVLLMRPGDSDGPPEETINCRCTKTTRFSEGARVLA